MGLIHIAHFQCSATDMSMDVLAEKQSLYNIVRNREMAALSLELELTDCMYGNTEKVAAIAYTVHTSPSNTER